MSYHRYYKPYARPVVRRPTSRSLGGLMDLLLGGADLPSATCPPSDAYNQMKAQIADLEATWKPTGVYTWNDMADMVAAVAKLSSQASSMATAFFSGASAPAAKDRVRSAAAAYNDVAKQALEYTASWQAAHAQNVPISAPGFKQWVIDDLSAALRLMRTAEVEVCKTPWFITMSVSLSSFFIDVASVAKRIAGVAVALAQNALKAIERTGTLLSYAPYIAIGAAAIYLWSKRKR